MKKIFLIIMIISVCFFNVRVLTCAAFGSSFFNGLNTSADEQRAGYKPIPKQGPAWYISKTLGGGIAPFFAGVMGMLLLVYGGFIWMMSRGREQEVERAKVIVTNTLIAMFVIFSAWAIVKLIMPLWELVTTGK